jgi:pilus assembly protein Flp/PilA
MERSMRALLVKFISNDSGATAIEYALMGSLLALVLVTVLTNLGTRLSTEFSEISGVLE